MLRILMSFEIWITLCCYAKYPVSTYCFIFIQYNDAVITCTRALSLYINIFVSTLDIFVPTSSFFVVMSFSHKLRQKKMTFNDLSANQ